ncbi:MAG TPA: biotin/lipoyl-containing protein, partial [Chloroflexota bacterium]|nr:biotin/lipoyl-containing protein [Chloroflexota bacterium]
MPFEFKLPDLGEGIHEAQVLAWKVRPGQEVTAFQPLCEVESAKAAVELTAPVGGRVLETRFAEGAVAQRGDVLVVIDTDGDGEWFGIVGSAPAVRPQPAERRASSNPVRAAPFVRKLARERGVRLEEIAGSGPHGRVRIADVEAHTPSPADEARGRKADVEAHR